MKTVTAIKAGFHGQLRMPGETFSIPADEEPGLWMSVIGGSARAKGKPQTLADAPDVPDVPELPRNGERGSVPASPPFTPAPGLFTVKHVPVGNFEVLDAAGNRVGELFKVVAGQNGQAKINAQEEADRLNKLAAEGPKEDGSQEGEQEGGQPAATDLPDA